MNLCTGIYEFAVRDSAVKRQNIDIVRDESYNHNGIMVENVWVVREA